MTAWHIASLPVWVFGYFFAFAAIFILAAPTPDGYKLGDRLFEAGISMTFGIPYLILAAWMWG